MAPAGAHSRRSRALLFSASIGEVPRARELHVSQTSTPAIPDLLVGEVPGRVIRLMGVWVTDEHVRFTLKTKGQKRRKRSP